MYILDIMEMCNDVTLSAVLPVVKTVMLIIQIVVPAALLISFTVDFVKLTINPDEKDSFRKLLNKVIAAVIVFALPLLVNLVMGAVGEKTDFSSCWNNASTTINIGGGATYIPDDDAASSDASNDIENN